MSATLVITIAPHEAAQLASIRIDGELLEGRRIDLPSPRRVRVSVTAFGYRRVTCDVEVGTYTELPVDLAALPHKKSRTLPVTIGMGVLSAVAWFLRRR